MSSNFEKLKRIIAAILKVDANRVSFATRMYDLREWSSLRHIELILAIEHAFGIKIPLSDIAKLDSVKEILDFLDRKIN